LTAPPRLLVSACLLGRPVRYDGGHRAFDSARLADWVAQGRAIGFCPEVAAGLPTPRAPAEIADGRDGIAVLGGRATIIEPDGRDVTAIYRAGAQAALDFARAQECRFALLTDGSPSCGSRFIYDGSFSGTRHDGIGVTTALLRAHGIAVFDPGSFDALVAAMEAPTRPSA